MKISIFDPEVKIDKNMPNYNLGNILFLDIETVSGFANFEEQSERMQYLWQIKAGQIYRRSGEIPEPQESYEEKAGIFAEFGKIVCISVGILTQDDDDQYQIRLKSFCDHDEKKLLLDFKQLLEDNPRFNKMCGHNLKEFDIPYICRRMMVNFIELPRILNISGKKPWELDYLLDTMLMWKFGDFKNYTSLSLLTALFEIPTPKDDIDGSEVGRVFWKEDDLERIGIYCEKDVVAVAQLLLRFERLPLVPPENIHSSYEPTTPNS